MMNSNTRNPKALTPQECREIYGLNPGTLANMRFHKICPRYYKLGRKVLYKAEDIERWLNENVVLTSDQLSS